VVILPGLGNASTDYSALSADLEDCGYAVETAVVRRVDWLRNAAGLLDGNYWRGTLNPRPTVDWYLKRVEEALEAVKQKTDGAPITLLAHSAGGWLGRIYMKDYGTTGIENFVTLGSPHDPPPKDKPGVFDQTRGILFFCQQEIPGTYHSDVNYVTVSGKYVKGCDWQDNGSFREKFVGACYKQVCGDADVWGDGIVPNQSSQLEGAVNIELTDVYHSPVGSLDGTDPETETSSQQLRLWYGSKGILEQWIENLAPVQNVKNQS